MWYAIEDIARMIKELDPHHLVTTVTAGIDKTKADLIKERVPSIDYLSINIYGGLETLPQQLIDIGYLGAYAVTEWGPTGHWQVAKTDWDVPIEQSSTEKAASYRSRYQAGKQATDSVHVTLGQQNTAYIELIQHNDQEINIRWEILPESTDIKAGGDRESRPQALTDLAFEQQGNKLTFISPNKSGAYRLFVYASTPANKIANANIPFYVDAAASN